ncbi:MAG: M16 family metallopeptidase [Mycobacteriales bacterium]
MSARPTARPTAPPSAARPIPALGRPRQIPVPTVSERLLGNGLRVLAVRRSGVPLAELRLRIPFAGTKRSHLPRTALLSEAFFSGTDQHSALQLASMLQTLGGALDAAADADALVISGSALAAQLPALLTLLAEILTASSYPKTEVSGHRERLGEELVIARSQPGTLAREAVVSRLFAGHPYGRELPLPEEVGAVGRAQLRDLHQDRVRPDGAVLVLVGDLSPARALDLAEATLAGWPSRGAAPAPVPPPPTFRPGGVRLVDRPAAVQSNVRIAGPGPTRTAPDYAATVLANMVFGGYFSSRLVANIREDKGYTYSPHSVLDHAEAATIMLVEADVATPVTSPALVEMRYELGRIASTPVSQEELDGARRYVLGTMALSTASQAGLAGTLANLAAAGLDAGWLRDYPRALAAVTPEDALAAALHWLAPSGLATVVVGDADLLTSRLAALDALD